MEPKRLSYPTSNLKHFCDLILESTSTTIFSFLINGSPFGHINALRDELVISCRAEVNEAKEIVNCLNKFCNWSRQLINFGKSLVHSRRNVEADHRNQICQRMWPQREVLGVAFLQRIDEEKHFKKL
ncbi:hypothetical protein M9H77_16659 [Catharanthus roseus]|uniref:Uncharacterized protein n=1 Tax=Catharanthus roseus TaxID=4058 RepID=A0ACC0B2E4_CATRO|nr:hypothetical protein M9H77_16659 [Catharanthus roseus]